MNIYTLVIRMPSGSREAPSSLYRHKHRGTSSKSSSAPSSNSAGCSAGDWRWETTGGADTARLDWQQAEITWQWSQEIMWVLFNSTRSLKPGLHINKYKNKLKYKTEKLQFISESK